MHKAPGKHQLNKGPGWVGDKFYPDRSQCLRARDIADYLGAHVRCVWLSLKRLGIELRPCQIEADRTFYEPFTDDEARRILSHLRMRLGNRIIHRATKEKKSLVASERKVFSRNND